MEMLFAALGGAILGAGARYLLPARHTYGALFVPAIGLVAASVVWAALTWLGWGFDGGWIWVVSLVIAGLVSIAVALVLPRKRRMSDDELLARLSKA
jgi:uncharacterized membrane protein YeaQ/YmgE (transglycosylase-associated protein family)